MNIIIFGIGGVGGYYGGMLAAHYTNSNINVHLVARGEHLNIIKEKGLHIVGKDKDFFARPASATDQTASLPKADYIIIATKSYHLEEALTQLTPCIKENTVIVPLLNGCDISEQIRQKLPNTNVWEGCTYIISRRTAPGKIEVSGSNDKIVFGDKGNYDPRLFTFEKIMSDAGINAVYAENITLEIWRKFFFISISASLTSYFDCNFNELAESATRRNVVIATAKELIAVANAEGIPFDEEMITYFINHANALPDGTTASMHSDFLNKRATEMETLTGTILQLGKRHNIPLPMYQKIYDYLIDYLKK